LIVSFNANVGQLRLNILRYDTRVGQVAAHDITIGEVVLKPGSTPFFFQNLAWPASGSYSYQVLAFAVAEDGRAA
jgi:hypothetical protein